MNSLILIFAAAFVALLLLVIVAVVAGVLIVRSRGRAGNIAQAAPTPLDVLEMRYARGEINREQFQEMRSNLKP